MENKHTHSIAEHSREQQLLAEVERLGRLAAAGQIAAGVVHEFNNILTAMLGWTQIAQRSAAGHPDILNALRTIEQNMQRAREISAELLGITRPDSNDLRPVNAGRAVNEALSLLSMEINTAGITVTRSIAPDAIATANPSRLAQVFINIIRNALDATPSRGTLDVQVSKQSGRVEIQFADTGIGISREDLERIFTPFFSTKSPGEPGVHGGSGLGLSICKKIVEDAGGTISIASRTPGGTTVTIILKEAGHTSSSVEVPVETPSTIPPGVSVLVMDDEPDICEMINMALSLRGAHVVMANSGAQALELCRTQLFNVAFLDFTLAGLSGHELSAAIAQIQPGLPVVFMSGAEIPNHPEATHANFLKKPFDLHEIQAKLQEILHRNS